MYFIFMIEYPIIKHVIFLIDVGFLKKNLQKRLLLTNGKESLSMLKCLA